MTPFFDVEHPTPEELRRINRGPSLLERNGFAIGFGIFVAGLAAVLAYGTWHVSTLEPVDPGECAAARGALFAEWQASYADAGAPTSLPRPHTISGASRPGSAAGAASIRT